MKLNTLHTRRGFSLIELLVVIAILSTLVALGAGAFFRVRAVQVKSATNTTVVKLNSALMDRWKEIGEQAKLDAKKNHPGYNAALGIASNDPDQALAIWMYAKVKNELPMTFNEARTQIAIGGSFTLLAKPNFVKELPALAVTTSPREQSAVCFYLAMTGSGNNLDSDSLNNQTADVLINNINYRCFKDSWGTPLAFVRQCYDDEVNRSPHVNGTPYDPFFPATLRNPNLATPGIANFWPTVVGNTPAFANMPGGYPAPPVSNTRRNFVPTLVSAGPNRTFDGNPFAQDDIVGFRLLQQGAQGD